MIEYGLAGGCGPNLRMVDLSSSIGGHGKNACRKESQNHDDDHKSLGSRPAGEEQPDGRNNPERNSRYHRPEPGFFVVLDEIVRDARHVLDDFFGRLAQEVNAEGGETGDHEHDEGCPKHMQVRPAYREDHQTEEDAYDRQVGEDNMCVS